MLQQHQAKAVVKALMMMYHPSLPTTTSFLRPLCLVLSEIHLYIMSSVRDQWRTEINIGQFLKDATFQLEALLARIQPPVKCNEIMDQMKMKCYLDTCT